MKESSAVYGMKLHISKAGYSDLLFGHLNDHGVHGMLEASLDAFDIVLPYIGGIVDSFCGTSNNAEATEALTLYVEMNKYVFQRNGEFLWRKDVTSKLQTSFDDSKLQPKKHSKNINVQKWLHRSGMP